MINYDVLTSAANHVYASRVDRRGAGRGAHAREWVYRCDFVEIDGPESSIMVTFSIPLFFGLKHRRIRR